MTGANESTRIRSMRPAKPKIDPWRPLGVVQEEERGTEGELQPSITVFLAGSECPFTCVYCDLWQYTLDGPTPPGAIPRQLEEALRSIEPGSARDCIKLYNASNFFERNAVPPEDLESIAELVSGFRRIVVECHPRLVDESCLQFADRLEGRLEVAMGLETAHPEVLAKLNKQMSLEDFEAATRILRSAQIDVRAFVLLAPPFLPLQESVDWAVRTTRYAWDLGVGLVSIVPLRSGNGEMERLAELGLFEPPNLVMLEETMVRAVESPSGVVLADLWEADRLEACPECREPRMERLRIINRTGQSGHEIACIACDQREGGRD